MKFYSGTTGWCLLWEICHLSSAVGNKVSLGVGFFLSGSIDWRTDDLKRPLGRLKRGHGKEWQWKQPSNHLLHTGLPAASASHSNSCNITVGIVQNLLQLYVRDLMLFFCIQILICTHSLQGPALYLHQHTQLHTTDGWGSVIMSTLRQRWHTHICTDTLNACNILSFLAVWTLVWCPFLPLLVQQANVKPTYTWGSSDQL